MLAYGRDGKPTDEPTQTMAAIQHFRDLYHPKLTDRRLKDDVRKEKEQAFEGTDTYRAIKKVFAEELGSQPEYAILPQVLLESPKLSRRLSTAWFAQAVDSRYQSCLAQRSPAEPGQARSSSPRTRRLRLSMWRTITRPPRKAEGVVRRHARAQQPHQQRERQHAADRADRRDPQDGHQQDRVDRQDTQRRQRGHGQRRAQGGGDALAALARAETR